MAPPPAAIELRHLRYFLAVIEELHFGRAAERVHIAQPPLSQAIRKVERELGVQLFNRTSRVVTPTAAGRAFAEQAADVLASFDAAVAETRRAGGLGTALRIGATPHVSLERVQAFVRGLSARAPSLRAHVTHLYSGEQTRRLRQGELDIGILHPPGPVSGLETEPLLPGAPLGVALPRTHPLAAKPAVGPADLRGEVLVTYPREGNPPLHDWLLTMVRDAGFSFADVHEANGRNARDLMLAVAEGLGVAVGPAPLVSLGDAETLVAWCPLAPALFMPDTVLAWRRHPPLHVEVALGSVREAARELHEGGREPGPRTKTDPHAALPQSR
jgi:DNA-binding transcriptional LysR family regulator